MKFAKELEQELVPEWRAKYLNYKVGKKKIKAISRALRHADQTPWTPSRRNRGNPVLASDNAVGNSVPNEDQPLRQVLSRTHDTTAPKAVTDRRTGPGGRNTKESGEHGAQPASPFPLNPMPPSSREQLPLKSPELHLPKQSGGGGYGSIGPSPSGGSRPPFPSALELPGPALDPNDEYFPPRNEAWRAKGSPMPSGPPDEKEQSIASEKRPARKRSFCDILPSTRPNLRQRGYTDPDRPRTFFRKFSSKPDHRQHASPMMTDALVEVRIRESEFFNFLDKELAKIESFYKYKEEEASERLASLKKQLHLLHDARLEDVQYRKKKARTSNGKVDVGDPNSDAVSASQKQKKPLGNRLSRISRQGEVSSKDAVPEQSSIQTLPPGAISDARRDYVRKQALRDVSYRSAKRKLKLALLEFYRGLELLKAYAELNRKAFRKMNKKYDKVLNARPTGRYMSENVNKAWFVQSEVIDNHLVAVEDLYTRYIDRGHRKTAIRKLRGRARRYQDHSSSAFRNGIMSAAGLVLGIQGLVYGIEHLSSDDDDMRVRTAYVLQTYGGYFLVLLHFTLFCLDCFIWTRSKINYAFVFEFDTRHALDWRQLAEIPCFFLFLQGLFLWLNFRWINRLFIYYPLILVAITVAIIFLPGRIFYHRSRKWWAYSNFRLLFAGLYPVEFRDFFLGDMYCSQTYAMGNIALFFCLYSKGWEEPGSCNSSHSRVMGFLTTLPGIWRGLQCLRRYRDTKDKFPHIVNFGKYTFTVLYYMTLSLYRIRDGDALRAIFIVCACINAIYTSIWDLAMDWSLGNPYSKEPFLREFLAFRRRWVYYGAMVIDPILRFTWIFYAIFTHRIQHSAILSFAVALLEVCRRGLWSIFRVENEHCTNVCRFRASRDIPLPYDLALASGVPTQDITRRDSTQEVVTVGMSSRGATGVDLERAHTGGSLRRQVSRGSDGGAGGTLSRVGNLMATAHAKDFQRRSRSIVEQSPQVEDMDQGAQDTSSEDEGDEDVDEAAPAGDFLQVGDNNLFEENGVHPHRK